MTMLFIYENFVYVIRQRSQPGGHAQQGGAFETARGGVGNPIYIKELRLPGLQVEALQYVSESSCMPGR